MAARAAGRALRVRDVFAAPSHRWGDPRARLLDGPAWEAVHPEVLDGLGLPPRLTNTSAMTCSRLDMASPSCTDRASGTKTDRPQWNACLGDLRAGDTLIIWRIDRLGRNLRDLIDIVTTLQARGVGVRSLSNGLVDTTTAHGALVFGMFALMAEYEAALIRERTQAGLVAARARGRRGGRKPKMTPELIGKAQRMYDARQFTMAEIAASCAVTPMTIYRHIRTDRPPAD